MKTEIRTLSHLLNLPGATVCAVAVLALAVVRAQAGGPPNNDAAPSQVSELTGIYTQVAVGDPDFGGGTNAPWIMGTGMVSSRLGPNGLPVLSTAGVAVLGTGSDMDPVTHELLWWSPKSDPYVSLDSNPVQVNALPFSYGYPNVNWYASGQSSNGAFYRTVEWEGTFKSKKNDSISLNVSVDDDAWIFIDGTMVAEDHYGYTSNTTNSVSAGRHTITIFYADRQPIYDAMYLTSSMPFEPVKGRGKH